jgi:hypothetical protein
LHTSLCARSIAKNQPATNPSSYLWQSTRGAFCFHCGHGPNYSRPSFRRIPPSHDAHNMNNGVRKGCRKPPSLCAPRMKDDQSGRGFQREIDATPGQGSVKSDKLDPFFACVSWIDRCRDGVLKSASVGRTDARKSRSLGRV